MVAIPKSMSCDYICIYRLILFYLALSLQVWLWEDHPHANHRKKDLPQLDNLSKWGQGINFISCGVQSMNSSDGNKSALNPITFTIFINKQSRNTQIFFNQNFDLTISQRIALKSVAVEDPLILFGPWSLSLLPGRTQ